MRRSSPTAQGSEGRGRRRSSFSVASLQQASDDYGALSAFMIHDDALIQEIATAKKRMAHGKVVLTEVVSGSQSTYVPTAPPKLANSGNNNKNPVNYHDTNTMQITNHFWELLETEVKRVGDYIQAQQQNLEFSAKALLTNVEAIRNSSATAYNCGNAILSPTSSMDLAISQEEEEDPTVVDDEDGLVDAELIQCLRLKTEELVQSCLQLQRFMAHNKATLKDVANYADEALHTSSCRSYITRLLNVVPWKESSPNSAFVVVLSDIFEGIRAAEERLQQQSPSSSSSSPLQWVAPSSFERHTTKYWVSDQRLTDLLLTAVAQAPLLVYGRSGRLTTKQQCLSNQSEGDKLWDTLATPISSVYFDSADMAMYRERLKRTEGAQLLRARWYGPKPQGNEVIFLELKTHHEKWVNTKSVKERVSIREKDMHLFLDAEKQWTWEDAEKMVLAATPTISKDALVKSTDLMLRMHELVYQFGLRPCVRSVYVRAAFQSPKSNELRLTVDRNICLIDESKTLPGSWCLSDDAVISNKMAVQVPYAVLEVKTADRDTPNVIRSLEDKEVIQEARKFSKFLTGAAAFNLHKINMLPHWAENPAFAAIFGKAEAAPVPAEATPPHSPTSTIAAIPCEKGVPCTDGKSDTSKDTADTSACTPKTSEVDDSSQEEVPRHASTGRGDRLDRYFQSVFRRRRRRHPHSPLPSSPASTTSKRPSVAATRPARVEPKSYFANERTFIQWISAALLLVTISVILLEMEDERSHYAKWAGIGVCMGAVLIVIYASFVYFRRVRLLQTGSPYGYVDHFGPVVLSLAVCIGILFMLVHFIGVETAVSQSLGLNGHWGSQYLSEEAGQCYLHSNTGISKLEYQPSDVIVDQGRNILLVASLQRIVSHPTNGKNGRVRTLIEIPSSNIEGLTVAGDRIFALSEGPRKTELIELKWESESTSKSHELSIVNRWKLKGGGSQAEGLVYVPDKTYRFGRLFVDVDGEIHIYNVPGETAAVDGLNDDLDPTSTLGEHDELMRIGTLNSHVLKHGLKELKISSMSFFEGIAYVLHDNEMIVRAWDLDEGDLLAEIPLPQVPDGFSQEWEGIALERRDIDDKNSIFAYAPALRGRSSEAHSMLIMHLALDTPAQIWSLAVQEGATRGDLVLPSCAHPRALLP